MYIDGLAQTASRGGLDSADYPRALRRQLY
jgi:hypothetical protein